MLTPGPESQGDLLQEQLELDLRNLFGSVAMSDDASDDDTCSSCSSVYSVGDVSIISQVSGSECEASGIEEEDEEGFVTEDTDESNGTQEPQSESVTSGCPGFAIAIDNLDMNVRRSDQRVGRTTQSYHFCHGYAALNRVDSTKLEDRQPSGSLSADQILPSKTEIDNILDDCTVLIERYICNMHITEKYFCCRKLVQNIPEYYNDKSSTNWHIESCHSQEMSKPSVIVSYICHLMQLIVLFI